MSVAQMFETFAANLPIPTSKKQSLAVRTANITKRLNKDFRGTESEVSNRFYGGSYGRNTAVASVSDIDLLYVLPYSVYQRYHGYASNGQSALLQAVRASIDVLYPRTPVIADGQIVKVAFTDGVVYELVPVFLNNDGSYTYADSNGGGQWRVCKPKHEIDAFRERDVKCNKNLVELCRMARAWRDKHSIPMSGMLIDTLAYQFMGTWAYADKSFLYYDWLVRDFFKYLADQDRSQTHWRAPGSGSYVYKTGAFAKHADAAHLRAVHAVSHNENKHFAAAKVVYRDLFGTAFPS